MRTLARITISVLLLCALAGAQDTRSLFHAQNVAASAPSHSPATRAASNIEFAGSVTSIPYVISPTAGQLILYAAATTNSAGVSVSDNCATSGSNSYTPLRSAINGTSFIVTGWARAGATKASCTVTFALSALAAVSVSINLVNDSGSGIDVSAAAVQANPGNGTNAVSSGTIATTSSQDYCWSFTADTSFAGGILTAGTSPLTYTQHTLNSNMPAGEEDGVLASVGSAAGTWTQSVTVNKQGTTMICVLPH
jgi:hypothetical protein